MSWLGSRFQLLDRRPQPCTRGRICDQRTLLQECKMGAVLILFYHHIEHSGKSVMRYEAKAGMQTNVSQSALLLGHFSFQAQALMLSHQSLQRAVSCIFLGRSRVTLG